MRKMKGEGGPSTEVCQRPPPWFGSTCPLNLRWLRMRPVPGKRVAGGEGLELAGPSSPGYIWGLYESFRNMVSNRQKSFA